MPKRKSGRTCRAEPDRQPGDWRSRAARRHAAISGRHERKPAERGEVQQEDPKELRAWHRGCRGARSAVGRASTVGDEVFMCRDSIRSRSWLRAQGWGSGLSAQDLPAVR